MKLIENPDAIIDIEPIEVNDNDGTLKIPVTSFDEEQEFDEEDFQVDFEKKNQQLKKTNKRISFEYAMIDGVNDTAEHAKLLAKHAKTVSAHINLIPLNYVEERPFKPTKPENLKAFIKLLEQSGANVTVRRKLGGDVDASCGQLRRKIERRK